MRKFWKNHKGVTMMEVLVTVGLLAIVIVPCLSSFVMAQRGNVLAGQIYDEYTQAANLMEELKAIESTELEERLKELAEDSEDGITVVSENKGAYFSVTIYLGELAKEDISEQTEYILKGVIAP